MIQFAIHSNKASKGYWTGVSEDVKHLKILQSNNPLKQFKIFDDLDLLLCTIIVGALPVYWLHPVYHN
jgi:hypothetical protein